MTAYFHRLLLASGRFFFSVRNGLFPTLLVVMVVATRPAQFWETRRWIRWRSRSGVRTVVGRAGVPLAVIGYAYIRRGGKNREVFANQLVTRGFYSHTRNPMYVGNYSMVLGFMLIYGSAWGYALMAPLFAYIYLAITTAEEVYLREKFGAAYA